MTFTQAEEQGKLWLERVARATEYYKKWEKRFRCSTLEEYYEGYQWKAQEDYEPYVCNLVYSSIKVKNPTLLFQRPNFFIEPKPNAADFNPEQSWKLAQLQTDTLNTVLQNYTLDLTHNVSMAILDSWFYYGIVEVGYSANWNINPNASKPALEEDYDQLEPKGEGDIISEPIELPEEERIYVKRIPAHRFRVGSSDCSLLSKADWCGYYEYVRMSDLVGNEDFKFTDKLEVATGQAEGIELFEEETDVKQRGDLIPVWKIWDNRAKTFNIIPTIGSFITYQHTFDRLPLFGLRFDLRRQGWYPVPPVWNWKSSQDEQNEAKEQLRAMRRRAKRAYQIQRGAIIDGEEQKLFYGPDGVTIWTETPNAINPVQNAPIDAAISAAVQTSKDDFNIVSGTTAEQRGESDRTTATQASLTNKRSIIRESAEREVVAEWLCDIAREVLLQVRERFTSDIVVKLNSDLGAFGQDYEDIQNKWEMVSADDLGMGDVKVNISVESLSPAANDIEKRKFMEFLAVLNQYQMLALNPILIRETAYRFDYRNEQVIRALQQAAQLQMIGQIEMANQQMGQQQQGQGGSISQKTVEQMQPPDQGEIENQMANSGVPVG